MIAEAVIDVRGSGLLLAQLVHRRVGEIAMAVECSIITKHQAIAENVVRRGEEAAGGFGISMNAIAPRLCQKANIAASIASLFFVGAISAGEPRDLRFAGPEGGFGHPQR